MAGMNADSVTSAGNAMPGMDHSQMGGMPGAVAQANAGAVDHSGMPGMSVATTQSSTGAVDHSRMPGMPGAGAQPGGVAADHAGMPGMPGDRSQPGAVVADHAQMPGMPQARQQPTGAMEHAQAAEISNVQPRADALPTDDAGAQKLLVMVARLVQDPVVQARIQSDPDLRERWTDEGVRRAVLDLPSP